MSRSPTPKKMSDAQMRAFATSVKQYIDNRLSGPGCNTSCDKPAEPADCQEPARPELQLVKRCVPEGPHKYGDKIKYVFTVLNCGNVPLTNVCIGDNMLSMASMKINLDPGEHAEIEEDYTVSAIDAHAGKLENIAKAEAEFQGIVFSSTASHSCSVEKPAAPSIKLTIKKPAIDIASCVAGAQIKFQYCVANTGGIALKMISVKDELYNDLGVPAIDLGVGMEDTTAFVGTYTLTQADIDAGCITCSGTACATAEGCGQISSSALVQYKLPAKDVAVLELVKSCEFTTGDGKTVGDIVTYTLCVKNVGAVDVTDVMLTDAMLGMSDAAVSPANLAAGEQVCVNCDYAITAADILAGEVVNTAEVKAMDGGDLVTAQSNMHTLALPELVPGWTFIKSCDPGVGASGDDITYTFVVTNTGDVPLTGVTIDDATIGVSGLSVPDLPVGASETITATYALTDADQAAGAVVNIATANADAAGTMVTIDSNEHTVTVAALVPAWTFEKSCDPGAGASGDDITYTFVVTNTGETPITGISIDDARIGVSGLSVPDLPVGGSETVTATYTLTDADETAGSVVNVATVNATANGSAMMADSNQHTVTVSADPVPAIEIVKSCDPGTVDSGEDVVYTFVVTNTGQVDLTGVTVDDATIGVAGLLVPDLPIGASETVTATYTATDADLAAGEIVNTASVNADAAGAALTADSNTHTVTVTAVAAPAMTLAKDCSPAGPVTVGDTITYTFTVTNTGNVDLDGVVVDDTRIGVTGLAVSPDPIPVGGTGTVSVDYVALDGDVGDLLNTATASGSGAGANVSADSPEHSITVEAAPTCSDDPLQVCCSAAGGLFMAEAALVPDVITANLLEVGQYGDGEFRGGGGSMGGIWDAGGVATIPVPAHGANCALFLNVSNGQISTQGVPVLQGATGTALAPSVVSQQAVLGGASDMDMGHTIIAMDSIDGAAGGTIDILLPDLAGQPRANAGDVLQWQWIEVCSANGASVTVDDCLDVAGLIEQSAKPPEPSANNQFWDGGTFTAPEGALVFNAGRHVINGPPGLDGQTNVDSEMFRLNNGGTIAANRLSTGTNWVCQSGLGTGIAGPGDTTWQGSNNSRTAESNGWTVSSLMTAIPFKAKPATGVVPVDETIGDCDFMATGNFCASGVDAVCSTTFDIDYDLEDGAVVTVTPIFDDVADAAQAWTFTAAGAQAGTETFTASKVVGQFNAEGDELSCKFDLRIQITDAAGSVDIPDYDACLDASV